MLTWTFFPPLSRAVYMVYLIERAKKCLDFSATLYIIHLLMCIIYGGWPSSITWWVVNGTGVAVMALLGEYLCIRRELREIPIRYRSSKPVSFFSIYRLLPRKINSLCFTYFFLLHRLLVWSKFHAPVSV